MNKIFFSLGNRVNLINTLLFSALITLFYLYNSLITFPEILQEKEERIKEIALSFKEDLSLTLYFMEDKEAIEDALKRVGYIESVLNIEIRDKSLNLIASYSKVDFNFKASLNTNVELIEAKIPYFRYSYVLKQKSIKHFVIIYYSASSYLKKIQSYQKFILMIFIVILIIILIYSSILKKILSPLSELAIIISNIDFKNFKNFKLKKINSNDERSLIINSTQKMLDNIETNLKELKSLNSSLEEKVLEKTIKLERLNKSLEEKVKKEVQKNLEKDSIMFQQARLAQMGEMIGNIAHQWRQPLNVLSLIIQRLEIDYYTNKEITENSIMEIVNDSLEQVDFMSKTIDDFRNFFKPNKEREVFFIKKHIEDSLKIISAQFKNDKIIINLTGNDFMVNGYSNEFKQVILNILSNSKDAFNDFEKKEYKINNKHLDIEISIKDKIGIIKLKDNAKGLDKKIIDRIFEPYFTTKHQSQGTGIGLYMSKMIIEKNMHGKLYVKNILSKRGVIFTIELPIYKENINETTNFSPRAIK